MKRIIIALVYVLVLITKTYAGDFKFVRTYDANGNVVATASHDEYIYAEVKDIPTPMGNVTMLTWGTYIKQGDDWTFLPGADYSFNRTNNGWYVFVCTIGYHSDYFYYKADGSRVRTTFMAGGNGRYKEFIPAKRSVIDRMAPTR